MLPSIICMVVCDDCGKSIVGDSDYISIFIDGDSDFTAATLCAYCERPVVCSISKEVAIVLGERGVKAFTWVDGEEVIIDENF